MLDYKVAQFLTKVAPKLPQFFYFKSDIFQNS